MIDTFLFPVFSYTGTPNTEALKEVADAFKQFAPRDLVGKVGSTLLLIVAVLFLKWLGAKILQRFTHMPSRTRRMCLVQLRNGALILLLFGVVGIWAEALRVLAYSLFAIAVATVIATKELIQCFSGSFLRSTGRSFSLGDRIEIGTLRGDVIDQNAMTTTILEVGSENLSQQPTGRAITIPNSLFLDKPVVNESFTEDFVLHIFKVPVKFDEKWAQAEADLLEAAKVECQPHLEDARKHFENLSRKEGLNPLSVEPRVTVRMTKPEEVDLIVRIAVPARRKSRLEQAILHRYLRIAVERKAETKKKPEADEAPTDPGI